MEFYSRSPNEQGKKERVADHLRCVRMLAEFFAKAFAGDSYAAWLAVLHDFGKYSRAFQEVLQGQQVHIDHSSPGAALAEAYFEKRPKVHEHLCRIIVAHHDSLRLYEKENKFGNLIFEADAMTPGGLTPSIRDMQEFKQSHAIWLRETELPTVFPRSPDFSAHDDEGIAYMLFDRMLLSALVDADYSASASHFEPDYISRSTGPALDPEAALAALYAERDDVVKHSDADSALNAIRQGIFAQCEASADLPPGLFTLTAPTGTGKTLSLMAFALRHAKAHAKRRIFIIMPYLSLLQQNVIKYKAIVPDLLESHSLVELDEHSRLLADRWSSPVVVTTSVRFFESLFASRASDCRALHTIADSVIVFDEAQSLPAHLLRATLESMKVLCERYGCSVVLSTATQPSFAHIRNLRWQPREIASDVRDTFLRTRRVTVDWQIKTPTSFAQIAGELAGEKSALAIVNLRSHARALYQELAGLCAEEECFFISSDMCTEHRAAVLAQIHARLDAKLPCRVVATQCVEAGVDLDFPVVYRSLGPLESIIQAAGRCNRNGNSIAGRVKVFLPEDERYPDETYQLAAGKVKVLLSRHEIDISDVGHIDEYYQLLYEDANTDKPELREAINGHDYERVSQMYKLIDNRGYDVIVPYAPLMKLYHEVATLAREEGLTKRVMAMARPITVSTFEREETQTHCEPIYHRSRERGTRSKVTSQYILVTDNCYLPKTGLHFPGSPKSLLY